MTADDDSQVVGNDDDLAASWPARDLMLGRRLRQHSLARNAAAALIVAAALVGRHLMRMEGLDVTALVVLAAFIALYNLAIMALLRPLSQDLSAARRRHRTRLLAHGTIGLDFLALTTALWLVGGVRSPFVALYLLHIVIASILLSRRAAVTAALFASCLFVGLLLLETTALLPAPLPAGATASAGPMDPRHATIVAVAYLGLFAMIVLSLTQLAAAIRLDERVLHDRASRLAKLSGMRRDFLQVALHDLNAPIGAATMLLDNLRGGLCGPLAPHQQEQVDRVLAKLGAMDLLVRDLRMLSELDSAELRPHSTPIPIAPLLAEVAEEQRDLARARGVSLRVEPCAGSVMLFGVRRLLKQAIQNYVTNGIKYTPPGGSVSIRCRPTGDSTRIEVADTGVGIAPEDQPRLFSEFVRLIRSHPKLGTIPGNGLGLSIVSRIAAAHGGTVGVDSETGQGSTFWIELPRA